MIKSEKAPLLENVNITFTQTAGKLQWYGYGTLNVDGYKVEFKTDKKPSLDEAVTATKEKIVEASQRFTNETLKI